VDFLAFFQPLDKQKLQLLVLSLLTQGQALLATGVPELYALTGLDCCFLMMV
jgi:hypothetical protein